jgi:hypothetical protein
LKGTIDRAQSCILNSILAFLTTLFQLFEAILIFRSYRQMVWHIWPLTLCAKGILSP